MSTVPSFLGVIANLLRVEPDQLGQRSILATTSNAVSPDWSPVIQSAIDKRATRQIAQAFFDPKSNSTVFLADRIPDGSEAAVFLHEMLHKHGKSALGGLAYKKLIQTVKSWQKRDASEIERQIFDAAFKRTSDAKPSFEALDDELLAYSVEESILAGLTPSISAPRDSASSWLAEVEAAIQQALSVIMGNSEQANLTPQALVNFAYALAQVESPAHGDQIKSLIKETMVRESDRRAVRLFGAQPRSMQDLEAATEQGFLAFLNVGEQLTPLTDTGAILDADLINVRCVPAFAFNAKTPIEQAIVAAMDSERFWNLLVKESSAQSGPFDGGCLICAKALIEFAGKGSIVRLDNALNGQPNHYGAEIDGTLYDFLGPHATAQDWADSFSRAERIDQDERPLTFAKGIGVPGDVPSDDKASSRIARLLTELKRDVDETLHCTRTVPFFHSALAQFIENEDCNSLSSKDWSARITGAVRKGLVKQAEVEWTDIHTWMAASKGRLTKADLLEHLQLSTGRITETIHTETKWAEYQLIGGKNYREITLRLQPERTEADFKNGKFLAWLLATKGLTRDQALRQFEDTLDLQKKEYLSENNYKSAHWDESNVLVHIRFNERTDKAGRKVLFVEEIQSDWGQDARRKGMRQDLPTYRIESVEVGGMPFHRPVFSDGYIGAGTDNPSTAQVAAQEYLRSIRNKVPAGPFINSTKGWVSLAIKRLMVLAVDEGFDAISFISGEQSALRNKVGHRIESLDWVRKADGTYNISASPASGESVEFRKLSQDDLMARLGAKTATAILHSEGRFENDPLPAINGDIRGTIETRGHDLTVGGNGMRQFYDVIVPNLVNDLACKFGGAPIAPSPTPVGPIFNTVKFEPKTGKFEAYGPDNHYAGSFRTIEDAWDFMDVQFINQPTIEITDAMREQLSEGAPLFSIRPAETIH